MTTTGGTRKMKKETLGQVLKQRRGAYNYTQRELARKLGVKASHVAYLENGRRRPSLSLLSRIADTLELDKRRLFLLAHPEAQWIVGEKREPSPSKQREDSWRRFAGDRGTLARHKVTERELKVLKNVNMLGRVSGPNQYLFILNAIRQAVDEE
jgi:transcriptional regulator with XRE-family HTH domain